MCWHISLSIFHLSSLTVTFIMTSSYSFLRVSRPFDPADRYTTSWLLSPAILALLRLSLSLWAFTTIFVIFGWNDSHGDAQSSRRSFSYFTNLTFWGLAFYFLFSGLHGFSYARSGTSWLRSWPSPIQAAHAIFYTTVVTFPFLVTVVYWGILYSGPWFPVVFQAWSNVCSLVFLCFSLRAPWSKFTADLATCRQLHPRSLRNLPFPHRSPAPSPSAIPNRDPRALPRTCVHHLRHPELLHVRLPWPRPRQRPCGGIYFRHSRRHLRRLWGGVGPHLDATTGHGNGVEDEW